VVSVAEGEFPGTDDPSAKGRPNANRRPGARRIPEPGAPTGGPATQGASKARVQAAARSDAAARLDVPLREDAGLPENPGARPMEGRETLGGDGRSDDAGSTVARRTLPAGNGSRRRPRGDGGAGQQVILFPSAPDSHGPADDLASSRDAANAADPSGGPGRPQGSSGPSEPDPVVTPDGLPWMEPAAAQPPKASRRDPKVPPWPGRIPEPSPAIVHHEPVAADVRDAAGASISVDGRGMLSAEPSWLRVAGDWARIVAWAGPWPVDERWWDPNARQRLARLQVTTQKDLAYLLKLTDGRWWVEATYD
jgi:hypothetical protein